MNELITVVEVNAVEVFTKKGLTAVLNDLVTKVEAIVPDVSTAKGRKEISSLAAKVAKSKTLLDGLGKDLVSEWKEKSKLVDVERKRSRDTLDALRDKVKQPLVDWQKVEADKAAAEILAMKIEAAHQEALSLNTYLDQQKELRRAAAAITERELAFAEKERKAQEEHQAVKDEAERAAQAAQDERDRVAYEEKLKTEAAEKAVRDMEQEAQREIDQANQRAADARAAEKRAEQDAAEQRRQADAAAKKLVDDRLEHEAAEAAEVLRRERNTQHRGRVNRDIVARLITLGADEVSAKRIVTAIAKESIDNLKINY